jgi:thiol:disulfide interchange protein DsbD
MAMSKTLPTRLTALTVLGLALLTPGAGHANPVQADHLQVALMSSVGAVRPGQPLRVGLHFELEDGWHVYWQNPGESGEPPRVSWELPPGFTAGPLEFPAPRFFRTGPITNYGYSREVLLPAHIVTPAEVRDGRVEIKAKVGWLVCREDCIPGKAELALSLPVARQDPVPASDHAELFAATTASLPVPVDAVVRDKGDALEIALVIPRDSLVTGTAPLRHRFFPRGEAVDHGAEQEVAVEEDAVLVRVRKSDRAAQVTRLEGVVVSENHERRLAWAIAADVVAPSPPAVARVASDTKATPPGAPAVAPSFWVAMLFAFLGGLILNLMPCVFPVLSLKILGFVAHAHDQRKVRHHGLAYGAGVLVSFWTLAGVLIALRAGAEKLGWGFQLQSPGFVAALVILMFLVALNLLGTFEVGLSLTRAGAVGEGNGSRNGNGLSGAFATGVLATIVATPCTAPFMGTALGYALTQPAYVSLGVFTSLALGMAAPYVVLAHLPRLLARLPRPGRWMETLKQALAFPMFATALWLLTVHHQLAGPLAMFKLLAGLLIVAAGAWLYGRRQSSPRQGVIAAVAALALVLGGTGLGVSTTGAALPAAVASDGDELWTPWSPERVATLRAEGHPVFVNFTATWCLSCKVNEELVFATDDIRAAFKTHKIAALKADWTNRDATIAAALESHGRAGVPLYLYYPAGNEGPPRILPSLLTKATVLEAFANN